MKRDVDILKRFTQMSCCLRHDLFQGISESIIMSVTLTSARRCALLSCSLEALDHLDNESNSFAWHVGSLKCKTPRQHSSLKWISN